MLVADARAADEYAELRSTLRDADEQTVSSALEEMATDVRRSIVTMIDRAQLGHIGGDLSVTDILVTLFGAVLSVDPQDPQAPGRDRFVLSKGHCAGALYATLARCGFFPASELETFMAPLSSLNGHPDRKKVPGVETNTGPLGHGLPGRGRHRAGGSAAGRVMAHVRRAGDGELQEGSNWEAAMTASHYDLASLTAIVDRNRLQQGARTEDTKQLEPLAEKWTSFGFEVREVDGHDYNALLEALAPSSTGRPVAVIAHTIKGKGVSFIEDRVEWHHKVPDAQQVEAAIQELSR